MRYIAILALLVACVTPAWAGLALDGTGFSHGDSGCNPCNISGGATLTTSGAGVVYVVVVSNGQAPTSATGCSLTFTQRAQKSDASGFITTFRAVSSTALSGCVVAVNFSSAPSFFTGVDFGISGADTSTIFDSNGSVPATCGAAHCSISTNNANDFIIGTYKFGATSSPTQGAGFTLIDGGGFTLVEYKIVSATQSGLDIPIGTGDADETAGIADAVMQAGATSPRHGRIL